MPVVFQGERGAFSELAAVEYFGKKHRPVPVPQFSDVFTAVTGGKARYGIVPIENSMAGSIHHNYDMMLENTCYIVGELYLRVSHFLITNKGVSRKTIRRVFSHPQAFAQCRQYLSRLTDVQQVPVSNTAAAVRKIREEGLRDAAAIASMQAAIDYDMDIAARDITDNPHNTTRFLVLSRAPNRRPPPGKHMKTSIVFSTKNIPGALFKSLSVFALRDINLLKIESRPFRKGGFQYLFYLDFEGSSGWKSQSNALNHLQEITAFYRFLGSYPVGREAHPTYRRRR